MPTRTAKLSVAIAVPIREEHVTLLQEREPRIELLWEPSLLPPMRHVADFSGDPTFRRNEAQQRRFEEMLDRADALYGIPDVQPAALRRTVSANPRLRWVHTTAAGGGSQVGAAGLSAAELERVIFTTSAGVHGVPLAEFAVFGILAGAKTLPRLLLHQRNREWVDRWTMSQLSSMSVLVYGVGGIGRETARLLSAFGARVIGVTRDTSRRVPGAARLVTPEEAISVAAGVQAVVAALPGTSATERMLGRDLFEALPQGTTVVNVGRGTVIDEDALLGALESGRVGFAALDVFAQEPLPTQSPFWTHERVLISPHTAALTDREEELIVELFARNAGHILDGREPENRVDTIEFY